MTSSRNAPSARFPVGRSRFLASLMLVAWLVGLGGILLWAAFGPTPGWRHGLTAGALLAAGAHAIWHWRGMPEGQLVWDGDAWWWHGHASIERPAHIAHRIDLQSVMLLQLRLTDGARPRMHWAVLTSGADATAWHALRRAVYFCADRQPPSGALPANP